MDKWIKGAREQREKNILKVREIGDWLGNENGSGWIDGVTRDGWCTARGKSIFLYFSLAYRENKDVCCIIEYNY